MVRFGSGGPEGELMAWLVTGGAGMLATDVIGELQARGQEYVAVDVDELDITDPEAVEEFVSELKPEVIVNCAAYTAVDAAEEDEAAAFTVNAVGPQHLAHAAKNVGATFVQISTDYVFGGDASTPYRTTDPLRPVGAYGRTKAAGEWASLYENPGTYVVRTAWLYGAGGACFPKTMARLLESNGSVKVVDDQFGQPTWTKDLPRVVVDLVQQEAPFGVYHGTSEGETSWCGFTQAIAESLGLSPTAVQPVTSEEFVRPAPRPSYSVLDHDRFEAAGVAPIGPWRQRWAEASPSVLAGL